MKIAEYIKTEQFRVYALAFIITILVFHCAFGIGVIVPTNITWLLSARHDWGQHYLGWAFYRHEPWTFPLGDIKAACYPDGTNVGLWDTAPLVALLFKPFSPILPEDFQYLGLWLLFCYSMVAFYTVKIFTIYNIKPLYVLTGVLFMVANPVLIYRGIHPALCGHGFFLAAIYYYLKPATEQNVKKINRNQIILTTVSSLINPYICFMTIGFAFIIPIKHYFYDKLITKKQAIGYPVITLLSVILAWVIFGMIKLTGAASLEATDSYGYYAFNLNGFINSSGFSLLMPQMPWVSWHQYEGYMYLGVGIMVLTALSLVYLLSGGNYKARLARHKNLLPLFILVLGLTLFAITNKVTYNDAVLFEFTIPELLKKLGSVFRASGRFVWVAYYLILLFVILVFVKSKLKDSIKAPVLILLCMVQLYDIKPLFDSRHLPYGAYDSPLTEASWNKILPSFKRMITYPPYNNHLLQNVDYQDFGLIAIKNHNSITSGYSAREDFAASKKFTDSLNKAIENGTLRDDEIYITTPQYLDAFSDLLHSSYLNIQYLDGYYVLYTNKNKSVALIENKEALKKRDSVMQAYSNTSIYKTVNNPAFNNSKIQYNIEGVTVKGSGIYVKGWAFLAGEASKKGDSVFVGLLNNNKLDIIGTKQLESPEVGASFKKDHLNKSGFSAVIYSKEHIANNATLCITIKGADGSFTYASINTLSSLSKDAEPVKLDKLPENVHQIGVIDEMADEKNYVFLRGWTVFENRSANNNQVEVVFMGKAGNFAVPANAMLRPDVSSAYNQAYNNSGYRVRLNKKSLPAGTYKLGLLIKDTKTKEQSMLPMEQTVTIK